MSMPQEQGHPKADVIDVEDGGVDNDTSQHGINDVHDDSARIEAVYRTLDRRIIPAFWTLYFLASAVRSNVALAQTMNTAQRHDLGHVVGVNGKQISTGLALFFVFYVVFNVPSNLVMSVVRPHVWMARIMVLVGVVGACMAAMRSVGAFYALRILLGLFIAGLWPGLTYYLTLFYPPSRIGTRIGYYFTASQVSAAVVGLVSAGFQRMDGLGGLVGFQWMFLLYGIATTLCGIALLWWLPDRPRAPPGAAADNHDNEDTTRTTRWYTPLIPRPRPALTGPAAATHYAHLRSTYTTPPWTLHDLTRILLDWRLWPLTLMYFGVVGVGFGVQNYGTVIIRGINPGLSSITLSLLFAPIWVCDLLAILLVTPLSDALGMSGSRGWRRRWGRAGVFAAAVGVQVLGLLLTTYIPASRPWGRYVGLLVVGFGLGPTVPVCMAWTSEIFQARHGEVGVAAASALVSGLGNLGSVTTTYALYTGWEADGKGSEPFRRSNLVMVGILGVSFWSAVGLAVVLAVLERRGGGRANVRVERGLSGSRGESSS
ncbi:MFS general substrate transporter [Pseudovirgaria hyperparasitica]|uniref:MFS general substrate transporter n=1 Tax=Pseudovirgaria hyperparasitica TaxID=470096 RepID=A0A6A6WK63_9PEZI|nr:MFS general substrate transporter [Pseudovirgaria hyperparasitica]KAF2762511.1 MFS general substrate transporter [Pseudovirgaria hyperparasitica]